MKLKLVYDIVSNPTGLDIANLTKLYEQHHIVFWDSAKGGTKPKLYGDPTGELVPMIVDTKGEEIDLEYYSKIFKDKEFWEREVYNCKNSPIYFYTNYGTPVWPHTDEGMHKYLKSVGMDKIEAKDDEEAKVLWEKQKNKVKEAMEFVTEEVLMERKAAIDVLKEEYNEGVSILEEIVGPFVRLVDSNNVPLGDKKRCGNLVEKIKRHLPVHEDYSEKYRTKKGKWDLPMLFVTDYKVLLKMFYDVLRAEDKIEDCVDPSTGKLGRPSVHD